MCVGLCWLKNIGQFLFISCLNCKVDRYLKKLAFSDLKRKKLNKTQQQTNKQTNKKAFSELEKKQNKTQQTKSKQTTTTIFFINEVFLFQSWFVCLIFFLNLLANFSKQLPVIMNIIFSGCTSGGVYVPCIYTHTRWELP